MKKITVYSRVTCAPCSTLKQFLTRKGIEFSTKDVDLSTDYAQEAYDLAGPIVPVTVIEDGDSKTVISGLNLSALVPAIQ